MHLLSLCSVAVLTLGLSVGSACAQEVDSTTFDFWLGEWKVSWEEAEGRTGTGRNTIVRKLDGAVIEENFVAETGSIAGYKGTSISVYNPRTKVWSQGYADNQGAYFSFIGSRDGDKRIFSTAERDNEKTRIQRMVFYDIREDSFTWDWESSVDGKTWKLQWRIRYSRIGE